MNGFRHFVLAGALATASCLCPAQSPILWTFHLSERDCTSTPALAPNGVIYVGNFDGNLLAIGPDGKLKWSFKTGLEIKSSPAVADDGSIYFGSRDRKFYALTPAGKLKWSFATAAWNDSSPAIATDGTVYFGSWDTNFYALNADGSLKWKFPSGGIIDSSPAIGADGTVYFGSHDQNLYALSPDGKLRWKFPTRGPITSSPAIGDDGSVYFASTDGNLYALRANGTQQWRSRTGGASESSPILGNGVIYVIAGMQFYSISSAGEKNWGWTTTQVWNDTTPVVLANGDAYFAWPWFSLVGVRPSQPIVEQIKLDGNITSSLTAADNGTIYFDCGPDLVAVTPTNAAPPAKSPWPMFRANPQHTGRVATH
jgi:outer membrane protein assembly factor BamB